MKKALLALIVFAVSLSALAQHRPGPHHGRGPHGPIVINRPIPRPMPHPMPPHYPMPHPGPSGRACQVVMIDQFQRVVRLQWYVPRWSAPV